MSTVEQLVESHFVKKIQIPFLTEMVEQTLDEKKKSITPEIEQFRYGILELLKGEFANSYVGKEEYELEFYTKAKHNSSLTFSITNAGGRTERHDMILFLEREAQLTPDQKIMKDGSYYRGKFENGQKLVLLAGEKPYRRENIALENLKAILNEISDDFGDGGITIILQDEASTEEIKFNVNPKAKNIKQMSKADFIIKSKEKAVYISHKHGMTPKHFQQWGGISERVGKVISEDSEVKNFGELLNKVFEELKLKDYPSSIDFQKKLSNIDLMLRAVFGIEYGEPTSSKDNVDYVIQGDLSLEPIVDNDEQPTGEFILKVNRVFSRKTIQKALGKAKNVEQKIKLIDGFFRGGYFPVFSVWKGDSERKSFGIHKARAAIYPESGRTINFAFTKDSTPDNIEFEDICFRGQSAKNQLVNVRNFFNSLQEPNEELLSKMYDSVKECTIVNRRGESTYLHWEKETREFLLKKKEG